MRLLNGLAASALCMLLLTGCGSNVPEVLTAPQAATEGVQTLAPLHTTAPTVTPMPTEAPSATPAPTEAPAVTAIEPLAIPTNTATPTDTPMPSSAQATAAAAPTSELPAPTSGLSETPASVPTETKNAVPAETSTPTPPTEAPTAVPASAPTAPPTDPPALTYSYVLNSNTKKFHRATCGEINKMNESNKVFSNDRDDTIQNGYAPCKKCNP